MGQAATLYCLEQQEFQLLANCTASATSPVDALIQVTFSRTATFDQTFVGLEFLLSKGQTQENCSIISRIFAPTTFLGEEIDHINIDWDNVPDDFDLESKAVYYNDPREVRAIFTLLNTIGAESFIATFDPDELNRQDIYPSAWNKGSGEEYAFNEQHVLNDFIALKQFFEHLVSGKYYCLVHID